MPGSPLQPAPASQRVGKSEWLVAAAGIAVYVYVLYVFTAAWARHSWLLYAGRDGAYNFWLNQAYLEWAGILDVTGINPIQGMTSMLLAINPWFNPGHWPFWLDAPHGTRMILSFVVYFLEVTVTSWALGTALGFTRLFAFAGAIWLALFGFQPFNMIFGLQGWFATAPMYAHTLALSNVMLLLYLRVGAVRGDRMIARNAALVAGLLVAALASLIAAPFYNAGMLLGTALAGVILLAASPRHELPWKLGCAVLVAAAFAALGMIDFYTATKAHSARFSGEFAGGVTGALQDAAHAKTMLCEWGVACERRPDGSWTGSYWMHVAAIAGGIVASLRCPPLLSRVAMAFTAVWTALLAWWGLAAFGSVPLGPFGAVYFYLMLYPLLALFSLYGLTALPRLWLERRSTPARRIRVALACLAAIALMMAGFYKRLHFDGDTLKTYLASERSTVSTPIIDTLRTESALGDNTPFRGSVATIYGLPGGTLRPLAGMPESGPLPSGAFEQFFRLVSESGSSHDLIDLWQNDIPTISEYGQALTPAFKLYHARLLSTPGDAPSAHFAIPTRAEVDLLRALGVRFVISDARIPHRNAWLREELPVKNGATLYLHELASPNLGTYSPLVLRPLSSVADMMEAIRNDPDRLAREAFLRNPPTDALRPAQNAQMTFVNGGVQIEAMSSGRSALLLPVQYSHCYQLDAPGQKVTMHRANLLHVLLVFEGRLDATLRWQFDFLGHSSCRRDDVNELKALGVL